MLRSGVTVEHASDVVWSALVNPQVYDSLVDERGWTVDAYVDWVVESFDRLLLQ
jgi:hypothetical protein